jgi:DNA-binding transcriptional MerR regulator
MDCYEAARMLKVAPSTIRSWSRKGWVERAGTSESGRALYRAVDLLGHARHRLTCIPT